MQLWKAKNSSARLGEKVFQSPAYLVEILHINRPMLKNSPVYDDLCPDEDCLGMVLDKTWNSHPMETQLVFPLFL